MHYEKTIIQKCFATPEPNTHLAIFIQGDIKKSTLYTCIVLANCLKTYFANYQFCNVIHQVSEGVKLFRK